RATELEPHAPVRVAKRERDLPACRPARRDDLEQCTYRAREPFRVRVDRARPRLRRPADLDSGSGRRALRGTPSDLDEIRGLELELEPAADDLQRVRQIVDQKRLTLEVAAQNLDRFQHLRRLRRLELYEAQGHETRVQRRA